MSLASWAARRQQARTQDAEAGVAKRKAWHIPMGVLMFVTAFIIWHNHGLVPALLFAGLVGIIYRLDEIIKGQREKR